jgi:hypothetical protein
MFKRGELAYRETVFGGCTNVGRCERSPLTPIRFECLLVNCPVQVVNLNKLRLVTRAQEAVVSRLGIASPGSVEHRIESAILRNLDAALAHYERKASSEQST